jgi:hypothetical protein
VRVPRPPSLTGGGLTIRRVQGRLTTGQTSAGNGRPVAHHPSRQGSPLSLRLAIRGPSRPGPRPGPGQLGPHARALPGTAAGACRQADTPD